MGTNGRYVLSSTVDGRIFVWNINNKELTAVIPQNNTDVDFPIRDIVFHPTKPLMIACGDDSYIYVYEQPQSTSNDQPKKSKK